MTNIWPGSPIGGRVPKTDEETAPLNTWRPMMTRTASIGSLAFIKVGQKIIN